MKKLILFGSLLLSLTAFSQTATEFHKQGEEKFFAKDYKGAVDVYTKAINAYPNNAQLYFFRALNKDVLKNYEGAIIDYTKAIEINPKFVI